MSKTPFLNLSDVKYLNSVIESDVFLVSVNSTVSCIRIVTVMERIL